MRSRGGSSCPWATNTLVRKRASDGTDKVYPCTVHRTNFKSRRIEPANFLLQVLPGMERVESKVGVIGKCERKLAMSEKLDWSVLVV